MKLVFFELTCLVTMPLPLFPLGLQTTLQPFRAYMHTWMHVLCVFMVVVCASVFVLFWVKSTVIKVFTVPFSSHSQLLLFSDCCRPKIGGLNGGFL